MVSVSPSPAAAQARNRRRGPAVAHGRHPTLAADELRQHRLAEDALEKELQDSPERADRAIPHVGADGEIPAVSGAVLRVVQLAAERPEDLRDADGGGVARQRV